MFLTALLTGLLLTTDAPKSPNWALPILDETGETIGSAMLLNPELGLTVAHNLPGGADSAVFARCGARLMFGTVEAFSEDYDLATIDFSLTPCTDVQPLKLGDADPVEGGELLIQGYPGGGPRRVVHGIVSGYDAVQFDKTAFIRKIMIIDTTVAGGNSGGPVVANSVLVGVLQMKFCIQNPRKMPPACFGVAAPLSTIRNFLTNKEQRR